MESFLNWAIGLLEGIERSPEKKQWCRDYSVYHRNPGNECLLRELYDFSDRAYEAGLVITNYADVIRMRDLNERQILTVDSEWLKEQPYLSVLACIAWHFRRDHFSEGSLISESIAGDALLRLFYRLKELRIDNDSTSVP